jgi:hypothetical protein
MGNPIYAELTVGGSITRSLLNQVLEAAYMKPLEPDPSRRGDEGWMLTEGGHLLMWGEPNYGEFMDSLNLLEKAQVPYDQDTNPDGADPGMLEVFRPEVEGGAVHGPTSIFIHDVEKYRQVGGNTGQFSLEQSLRGECPSYYLQRDNPLPPLVIEEDLGEWPPPAPEPVEQPETVELTVDERTTIIEMLGKQLSEDSLTGSTWGRAVGLPTIQDKLVRQNQAAMGVPVDPAGGE